MNSNKIVIVEDSPTQALKLQILLEDAGLECVCYERAIDALESMNESIPSMVIVDYFLPGMRGDEFCQRMKNNNITRQIPILMLTAQEGEETEVRALDSGTDGFLSKSVDPDILIIRVKSMLERTIPEQLDAAEESRKIFERGNILAIDDSETYLQYLLSELDEDGYIVDTASSGEAGLEKLRTSTYDCVLVDLMMPGIDGMEVCRQIEEMRKRDYNPIAVLMLTGHESKDELGRALSAGADDFVGKSSDIAVLRGRIRALLRRKFFQEENQRILKELRNKELEAVKARAAQEAAETRASLVDELERSQKELIIARDIAEKASKSRSEFLANMSHEIRTPLNGVVGMTSLLLETELDTQQFDYLHSIQASGDALMQIINDILDLSKIDAGKLTIENYEFELAPILEACIEVFTTSLFEKPLRLNYSVAADVPKTIISDPTRIRQIILNLISNAIKFTQKGEVFLRVELEEELIKTSDTCMLRFDIIDTGIGISKDRQDSMFDAFSQEDASTTRRYGGTGLGLTISKRLSQLMGGDISLQSEVGKGSHFSFTVRVEAKQEPELHTRHLYGNALILTDCTLGKEATSEKISLLGWKTTSQQIGEISNNELHLDECDLLVIECDLEKDQREAIATRLKQNKDSKETSVLVIQNANNALSTRAQYKEILGEFTLGFSSRPVRCSALRRTLEGMLPDFLRVAPEENKTNRGEIAADSLKGLRILVAEDNRVNQIVTKKMLTSSGGSVEIAQNGVEAVNACTQNKYDLVLMDLHMPEMNGFEASVKIRQIESCKEVPILALTANVIKGEEDKAVQAGMQAMLSKPIKIDDLRRAVVTHAVRP